MAYTMYEQNDLHLLDDVNALINSNTHKTSAVLFCNICMIEYHK